MFERFSEPSIKVLHAARLEALALGSDTIETNHLLLGLRFEGGEFTRGLIREFGLDLRRFIRELEKRTRQSGGRPTPLGHLPFSSHFKRALVAAAGVASEMGFDRIGPEHLLLGLLKEDEELAARIQRGGLSYDLAKSRLVKSMGLDLATGVGFENDPTGACGVCKQPLSQQSNHSACPKCHALYHADCWEYNCRRCAVFGCVWARTSDPPIPADSQGTPPATPREEVSAAPDLAISSSAAGPSIERETITITLGVLLTIVALWVMSALRS